VIAGRQKEVFGKTKEGLRERQKEVRGNDEERCPGLTKEGDCGKAKRVVTG